MPTTTKKADKKQVNERVNLKIQTYKEVGRILLLQLMPKR